MSKILDFYRLEETDDKGRSLEFYWSFSAEMMEKSHTTIQWMFPLQSESDYSPDAPILTQEDVEIWKQDPILRTNLRHSFSKWLWFCGLWQADDGIIDITAEGIRRFNEVFWGPNHNWLRITRVLLCLKTLGLEQECNAFWDILQKIHAEGMVTENTMSYWKDASRGIDRKWREYTPTKAEASALREAGWQ